MELISIDEAQSRLDRLVERAAAGEDVVLTKDGKPVARLVPLKTGTRQPGRLEGRTWIADDVDAPLPEPIAAVFRGEKE